MLVGSSMVGKTKALSILQETYNLKQKQEFNRKRKEFIAKKQKLVQDNKYVSEAQKDFDLAANSQVPADQLSGDELKLIKRNCHELGVNTFIINPKAQKIGSLVGYFDKETREFIEGLVSLTMREAIKQKPDKF